MNFRPSRAVTTASLLAVLLPTLSVSDVAASPLARWLKRPTMSLVSFMTGLPNRRDVPVQDLTVEEARDHLAGELKREADANDLASQSELLSRFGFLPREINLQKVFVDALAVHGAGFYNTRNGVFYNVTRFGLLDLPGEPILVAHELTHAVQDQSMGALAVMESRTDDDDRARALQWVLEGQATLIGNRAGNFILGPVPGPLGFFWGELATIMMWSPLWKQATAKLSAMAEKAGGAATPPFILDGMLAAYYDGSHFVWEVERALGRDAHRQLVCHPPQSMEQVLHPEKYLGRKDPPLRVTIPPLDGKQARTEGTAGEWGIRWLIGQALDGQHVDDTAGWGGDRMALMEDGSIVWRIVMDDEKSAERLFPTMYTVALKMVDRAVVRHRGREIHIWSGPMSEYADELSALLLETPVVLHSADAAAPNGSVCR